MSHYDDEFSRENSILLFPIQNQLPPLKDAVYTPKHYAIFADGSMESIDVIRAALTPEEYKGFLKGNILKYRLRAGGKDAISQEIAKADNYNRMLREFVAPKE